MATKKKPDKPATILRRAKRILKERGWGQGNYFNRETGNVCLVGSLDIAAFGETYYTGNISEFNPLISINDEPRMIAYEALQECAVTTTGNRRIGIATYNDKIAKSPEDAQKLLNCAIKRLETKSE